jgi:hypothetical protein
MQRWGKLKWVMGQQMKLLPLPLLLLPALQGKMQWLQLMMGPLLLVVSVYLFDDLVKLLLLPPLHTHYVDLGEARVLALDLDLLQVWVMGLIVLVGNGRVFSFICINRIFGVVSVISYLRDYFGIKKKGHYGQ